MYNRVNSFQGMLPLFPPMQYSPSFSFAVNLIERGAGTRDVTKNDTEVWFVGDPTERGRATCCTRGNSVLRRQGSGKSWVGLSASSLMPRGGPISRLYRFMSLRTPSNVLWMCSVGLDDAIVKCQLELSACDVITAWASGCSWNDALFIAGSCTGGLGEDAEPRIIPAMALQNGIAPLGATWGTILRSSLMPRRGPISRLYRFISLRTLATSRGCAAFFLPRRCGCKMSTRAQHM